MLNSDDEALALADQFYSAALGAGSWHAALEGLAAATGSRTGELIVLGPAATMPLNLMTNVDPELNAAFMAARGADPAVNPRVAAGMRAPVLRVLAENDFLTPQEHKVHPHYDEFARPWDIPYICLTTLDRRADLLVGLAVCRSEREGHINDAQRAVFAAIAPHVRAAVRMHQSLEEESVRVLSGAFEALSTPAFICDRSGRVKTMTSPAEEIVAAGGALLVRGGQLMAAHDRDATALSVAIETVARATGLDASVPRTLVARSVQAGARPLVLDVVRLPSRAQQIHPTASVLVIVQGAGNTDARRRVLLRSVYRLTAAEIDIALQLAQGSTAESIAAARGVAVATVRAQIKSILAKLGLRRQVELVARIAQF